MITDEPDSLLWSARKERAKRWSYTESARLSDVERREETKETLVAAPKVEQVRKCATEQSAKSDITFIGGTRAMDEQLLDWKGSIELYHSRCSESS